MLKHCACSQAWLQNTEPLSLCYCMEAIDVFTVHCVCASHITELMHYICAHILSLSLSLHLSLTLSLTLPLTHPPVVLVVSSSCADPLESFSKLYTKQKQSEQGKYPKWITPHVYYYYVLLHDVIDCAEAK